jgi:nucleolar protein 58
LIKDQGRGNSINNRLIKDQGRGNSINNHIGILLLFLSHVLVITLNQVKFNPGRADNMVIQSIALLDQLDKDINTFAMRVREWYSWHFPELAKIVTDNIVYSKAVMLIGMRTNVKTLTDEQLLEVVPEEIASEVREAAEIFMYGGVAI